MLIGHKKQLSLLKSIIEGGKVPHAFIFSGPENLGKQLLAKMFFYKLSESKQDWSSFFASDNKLAGLILKGSHPDLFFIGDDGVNVGIEEVRKLKQFVALSPYQLSRKFVLITSAEKLNRESFNSLLKTMEEPGENTVLVLTTNNLARIPKTIVSRSVLVNFQKLSDETLLSSLKEQNLKLSRGELAWIAGRPGLALKYINDPQEEEVRILRENFISFTSLLNETSTVKKFALAQSIASGEMLPIVLQAWMLAVRAAMIENKNSKTNYPEVLRELAALKDLIKNTNVNKRLQLESMLLKI